MREIIMSANQKVGEVQGWVGDRIFEVVEFASIYHGSKDIKGDILEIGVHHGKLFFLLSSISRANEKCIAVDIFDRQDLNLDLSGQGSLSAFNKHLEELFPDLADRVKTFATDSMSLTPSDSRSKLGTSGVRLFSVDGGHNIEHAVNDLCLAQELIVPGGVVMLDDFLGPLWPSVTEGFFKYMNVFNRRLAPFLIFQNKVFLTTYSEQPDVLTNFRKYVDDKLGAEIHSGRWKYGRLCGFEVLGFS